MLDFTEYLTSMPLSVNQTENNFKNGEWDRRVFLKALFLNISFYILYFSYEERVIPNPHIPKGSVMQSQYF